MWVSPSQDQEADISVLPAALRAPSLLPTPAPHSALQEMMTVGRRKKRKENEAARLGEMLNMGVHKTSPLPVLGTVC